MSKYSVKNFVRIANEFVNPDTSSFEGVKNWLIGWFCIEYKTTPLDGRLLELTIEELMILYNMHQIRKYPDYYNEQINPEDPDGYEAWIKAQMGEDYQTEHEMVEKIEEEEEIFQKRIAEKFPDKITTDFSQLESEE